MQHAITIGDLVWWSGGVIAVLIALGIIGAILKAIGSGFSH
jgi:hypothetical protein